MNSYKIPLGNMVEWLIEFLTTNFAVVTNAISAFLAVGIEALISLLEVLPPLVMIIIFGAAIWKATDRKLAIFSIIGFTLIWNLGYWSPAMSTIALVVFATLLSILIGVPLGIVAALSNGFNRVITPILDFMQTMPAFVYLIPAIPFFG
jgi:glycine betaine/proline transport system permease protein